MRIKRLIDINCDMGEGIGNDEAIMPFITSANISCGYHAGDNFTIKETMLLSKKYGVHIGAHPSFADKENFGRKEQKKTPAEIYKLVKDQLILFFKIANENKCIVHHVKPHGALYNMAARDAEVAASITQALKDADANLILYGLSGSLLIKEARAAGLKAFNEVFADRTYQDDGSLTPRTNANALIEDAQQAAGQVKKIVNEKKVTTLSGTQINIEADTVCIHGDGNHAVEIAKAVYDALLNK